MLTPTKSFSMSKLCIKSNTQVAVANAVKKQEDEEPAQASSKKVKKQQRLKSGQSAAAIEE